MQFPKVCLLITFLLFFDLSGGFSQKIVFEGLKRTKPAYLLKITDWEKHKGTDSLQLEKVAQSLRNTRLFSEVDFKIEVDNSDTLVIFNTKEVRTLLPILEVGATENNKWFRLGIKDENGGGKAIRTVFFYQYNDRHSFYLKQSFPFIFKKLGINYLLRKWSFLEPFSLNDGLQYYNYDNLNAELSVNYAFDVNRNELETGLGFIHEEFIHTMPDIYTESPSKYLQNKISFKAIHNFNHLNYNSFYLDGWANTLNILSTYEVNEQMSFVSVFNDFRFFKSVSFKGNLALRSRLGISTNSNVFLAPFVLDNYFNIRGIGNRVDRGTASIVLNAEYRQTMWENKTWGIQTVGFIDSGTWREPNGELKNIVKSENMIVFGGLGTRLIYKKAYDVILRLDYGWGFTGLSQGFVFGIGQYF